MAVRKVAVLGHPVLRQKAAPIAVEDIHTPRIQELIKDMVETMLEYDGRGLAAPQIHESLQIVVMLWDFTPKEEPSLLCLINPKITELTEEKQAFWEGCLSVPDLRGKVFRPKKVSVHAYNEKAEEIEFEADGFLATVIQHECDHLIGTLYLDRMDDLTQLAFNKEYSRYLAESDRESD